MIFALRQFKVCTDGTIVMVEVERFPDERDAYLHALETKCGCFEVINRGSRERLGFLRVAAGDWREAQWFTLCEAVHETPDSPPDWELISCGPDYDEMVLTAVENWDFGTFQIYPLGDEEPCVTISLGDVKIEASRPLIVPGPRPLRLERMEEVRRHRWN